MQHGATLPHHAAACHGAKRGGRLQVKHKKKTKINTKTTLVHVGWQAKVKCKQSHKYYITLLEGARGSNRAWFGISRSLVGVWWSVNNDHQTPTSDF